MYLTRNSTIIPLKRQAKRNEKIRLSSRFNPKCGFGFWNLDPMVVTLL